VSFDEVDTPNSVDALCELAAWSRRDLAKRLGVGESVLNYYLRNGEPHWLAHALVGIAVVELGVSVDRARELLENASANRVATADPELK
jgi:transcriptional regulator with XRE-family HTH domain